MQLQLHYITQHYATLITLHSNCNLQLQLHYTTIRTATYNYNSTTLQL